MAAKTRRPEKVRLRGCYNFKSGRPKKAFKTEKEARDFLRANGQLKIKEPYPCGLCRKIHTGRTGGGI